MLVAAAVLPHPPLMVPAVAADAALELDALRVACTEAVANVMEASPEALFIVGGASEDCHVRARDGWVVAALWGGFAARSSWPSTTETDAQTHAPQMHWASDIERSYDLPLSMTVAAYLLATGVGRRSYSRHDRGLPHVKQQGAASGCRNRRVVSSSGDVGDGGRERQPWW